MTNKDELVARAEEAQRLFDQQMAAAQAEAKAAAKAKHEAEQAAAPDPPNGTTPTERDPSRCSADGTYHSPDCPMHLAKKLGAK